MLKYLSCQFSNKMHIFFIVSLSVLFASIHLFYKLLFIESWDVGAYVGPQGLLLSIHFPGILEPSLFLLILFLFLSDNKDYYYRSLCPPLGCSNVTGCATTAVS